MNLFQQNIYRMRKGQQVVDPTIPTAPSNLQLISFTEVGSAWEVVLDWNASTDDVGIDYYEILYSLNGGAYTAINTTTSTGYTISLAGGDQYGNHRWKIIAYDTDGNTSPFSNTVFYYKENTSLYAPTGLYVRDLTHSSNRVSFQIGANYSGQLPYRTRLYMSRNDGPFGNPITQGHTENQDFFIGSDAFYDEERFGIFKFKMVPLDEYMNEGPPSEIISFNNPIRNSDFFLNEMDYRPENIYKWSVKVQYVPVTNASSYFFQCSFNSGPFMDIGFQFSGSTNLGFNNLDEKIPRHRGTYVFKMIAKDGTTIKSNTIEERTFTWENLENDLPPTNIAPVANDVTYTNNGGFSINSANGLLNSVTNSEGNYIQIELVTPPTSGTLTLNSDGSFFYAPPVGEYTFTYRAYDYRGYSNIATVTLIRT